MLQTDQMTVLVSMLGAVNETTRGRVLIIGMGISGMAAAGRLHRAGWQPVIIEKAPERRTGGYFVALFGAGREAARRLGFLDRLHDRTSMVPSVDVDRTGRSRPGMSYSDIPGRPWLLLRGDVEEAAYSALPEDVEVRYATVPTAINQDADGVDVTLRDLAAGTVTTERFDLVVGADGLRSTVRQLVFGPHEEHLRRMGYMIAAFEFPGTPAGLAPGAGATLLEPHRAMWVFAFSDHDPTILLTYRTHDVDAEFTRPPIESVRAAFGPKLPGDTLGSVLDAMEKSDTVLFDSVEQVRMDRWHRGRVVLLGDSAWCVTLYAGMGVSSGLMGADLLGEMLERHPHDPATALDSWEKGLRPYLTRYQNAAPSERRIFVMDSRWQILQRRLLPALLKSRLGRKLADRIMQAEDIYRYKTPDVVATILDDLPTRSQESSVA